MAVIRYSMKSFPSNEHAFRATERWEMCVPIFNPRTYAWFERLLFWRRVWPEDPEWLENGLEPSVVPGSDGGKWTYDWSQPNQVLPWRLHKR